MDIKELQQIIINNFYDTESNTINISGMDFGHKNIDISMITARTIEQYRHEALRIIQNKHYAEVIQQEDHTAERIYQDSHNAEVIAQDNHYSEHIIQD